jgi:hypothetical protein
VVRKSSGDSEGQLCFAFLLPIVNASAALPRRQRRGAQNRFGLCDRLFESTTLLGNDTLVRHPVQIGLGDDSLPTSPPIATSTGSRTCRVARNG